MSQKLHVKGFKWVKETSQFDVDFIKNYKEESDEGYFLESDIQYLKEWHKLDNDLPFFPERKKIEKIEKVAANSHNETEYAIQIRNLKQALGHGLVLKKVHRVIKFILKTWLKPWKM